VSRGPLVLVRGAGDLATGCAVRLSRSGFAVVMTELAEPTAVRRTVAFSEAVVAGTATVEGVVARRVAAAAARRVVRGGEVALVVDPAGRRVAGLVPDVVVDARMAKRNLGTRRRDAPIVIGLGPGFVAGRDVHAVIETNRGHALGAVILAGAAEPNTGVPGEIAGHGAERLLRAPATGRLRAFREIGERVEVGDAVGEVEGEPVQARIGGVLGGFLRDGSAVRAGQKIGDVDPRAKREHCFTVSDKARAVAGGVLEAVLYLSNTANPASGRWRLPTTTRAGRRSPRARSRRARS
jgi:xanthine dehydrogenase accessory factor